MNPDPKTSRRRFLKAGAALAGAGLCGCAMFRSRAVDLLLEPEGGAIVFALETQPRLSQPGQSLVLQAAGSKEKILLFRRQNGQLSAVSMICPHWSCEVEFVVENDRIECPCHGSVFGPDGSLIKGPAEKGLSSFPVTEEGGTVRVELG